MTLKLNISFMISIAFFLARCSQQDGIKHCPLIIGTCLWRMSWNLLDLYINLSNTSLSIEIFLLSKLSGAPPVSVSTTQSVCVCFFLRWASKPLSASPPWCVPSWQSRSVGRSPPRYINAKETLPVTSLPTWWPSPSLQVLKTPSSPFARVM